MSIKTIDPPDAEPGNLLRRNFLSLLWGILGLALLTELMWLVRSFFRPLTKPVGEGSFGSLMEAGPVNTFLPGTVTAFPIGHFYLARLEDGGFLALSRRCTHLGCTVPWVAEEKRFLCPCHSSAFDIRGEVVRPPAPRALDLFRVTIQNNVVMVDSGNLIKRSRFKKEQVVYPSS
jgi:cytochrome b6-f complex iron-sulfur subunit